jgi:hypothetical protein
MRFLTNSRESVMEKMVRQAQHDVGRASSQGSVFHPDQRSFEKRPGPFDYVAAKRFSALTMMVSRV